MGISCHFSRYAFNNKMISLDTRIKDRDTSENMEQNANMDGAEVDPNEVLDEGVELDNIEDEGES